MPPVVPPVPAVPPVPPPPQAVMPGAVPQNSTAPPVVTFAVATTVLPLRSPEVVVPVAVTVTAVGVPPAHRKEKFLVVVGHWPVGCVGAHAVKPVLPDSVQAIWASLIADAARVLASVDLALLVWLRKLGSATALKIPTITITIISSTSVKPFWSKPFFRLGDWLSWRMSAVFSWGRRVVMVIEGLRWGMCSTYSAQICCTRSVGR